MRLFQLEPFGRLSLLDVRAYLVSQGWTMTGRFGSAAIILEKSAHGRSFEILLPIKQEVADYADRMRDAVEVISVVEERESASVYSDLVKSGFDVVRLRAPNSDASGTIAFEQGASLYDEARAMIAASANSVVKPRGYYRSTSADAVKDYMSTLRLGQTEVGSYILTLLSPVPPALQTDQLSMFPDDPEVPFARLVTKKLDHSLTIVKQAIAEATATGTLEPFEKAIPEGVSANLCEALANLAEHVPGIEVMMSWSRGRPEPTPFKRHTFTPDNARLLSEAASKIRDREPQSDASIEGFVVGLQREHDEFDGRARIRGFVDGKVRTLTAEFLHPDYVKVLRAHDLKLRVRVDGDVVRRGIINFLSNPRNLTVLDDQDEAEAAQ